MWQIKGFTMGHILISIGIILLIVAVALTIIQSVTAKSRNNKIEEKMKDKY